MDCENCGGVMVGDGYTQVLHCEFAEWEKFNCVEPDGEPVYCDKKHFDFDDMPDVMKITTKEEELDFRESIARTLLIYAMYNDANKWFAGIRKPSKITINLLGDLVIIYDERRSM